MDPYQYEFCNRRLSIRQGQVGHTDEKLVGITAKDQQKDVMAFVKPEDAPAVALAILEAAGISREWDERVVTTQNPTTPEEHFAKALNHLDYGIGAQTKLAEREAEDAKVKGYRLRLLESSPETANHRAWSEIDDVQRDLWRCQYRAAREFFKEGQ